MWLRPRHHAPGRAIGAATLPRWWRRCDDARMPAPPDIRLSPVQLGERLRAEREGKPFLELADGRGDWKLIPLTATERITVGRHAENDIALEWDTEASRLHAVFECMGGSWVIQDDGLSRNGTFLNGDRVSGYRRMENADRIRIGRSVITFRDPIPPSDETAPSTSMESVAEITPAQRRVLIALCRPYVDRGAVTAPATNREIAQELVLSVEGVRTHVKALFERLGVGDLPPNQKRAELVKRAFGLGVIKESDLRG